jgi:tetratricopeptide (TPR) repeat protein
MKMRSPLPIPGLIPVMLLAAILGTGAEALAQAPQDPMTEGIALFEAGDDDAAAAVFEKQTKARPGDARAAYYLARVRFTQGDADGAVEWLEKATELAPNDSDNHLWLGNAYLQQLQTASIFKKIDLSKKVRAEYTRAIELDPDNLDAREQMAGVGQRSYVPGLSPSIGRVR